MPTDAFNSATPLDTDAASGAAAEFRALKLRLNNVAFFQDGVAKGTLADVWQLNFKGAVSVAAVGNVIEVTINSSFTGDVTVGKNLIVAGQSAITDSIAVAQGNISIANGYLAVDGNIYVNGSRLVFATGGSLDVGTEGSFPLHLGTNSVVRATVTSDGKLLIGTETDNGTDKLQIAGSVYASGAIATGGQFASDGDIYMNGSRNFYTKGGTLNIGTDNATYALNFRIGNVVKTTVSPGGNLLVGTETDDSSGILQAAGSISMLSQAWNGNRLKLGSYQLWFDGSNNLRFKTSAPTGDTDGTIVGGTGLQTAVQFQDEGTNLGTSGTATVVNFTGGGVTASRATNTVTVNVPAPSTDADTVDGKHASQMVQALAPSTGAVTYAASPGYISLLCTVSGVTTYGDGVSTVTIQSTSDRRLKRKIRKEKLGLSFVDRLNAVTYQWKPGHGLDSSITFHGLIHDEVAALGVPEGDSLNIVRPGGYNGVDYMSLIAVYANAFQEVSARLEKLEKQVFGKSQSKE